MNANDKISTFIKLYFGAAVKSWRETGQPVTFVLGDAGLESDWGNKAPQNAFFGIKAGRGWMGKKQQLPTQEVFPDNNRSLHKFPAVHRIVEFTDPHGKTMYRWYVDDWFRAYDTAAEGFADHGRFLLENPRYAPAFDHSDAREFATEIAAAGYATEPAYAKLLHDCIDSVENRLPLLGLTVPA